MQKRTLLVSAAVFACTVALALAPAALAAGDSSGGTCQHKYDKAKVCTICGHAKSGTVKLKAKKYAYVNKKTWIKIKAKKKGYVTLKYKNAANDADSIMLQVYNASKKKFKYMGVRTNEKGHLFFPVKKATYYLKLKDPVSARVKYTFKAVKCPPAFGIDGARSKKALAKNKTATVLSLAGKYDYRQTFKIKLKKKQRIKIKEQLYGPAFISLYTSSGRLRELTGESSSATDINYERTRKSKKKLSAGTYYIIVDQTYMGKSSAKDYTGALIKLSWS